MDDLEARTLTVDAHDDENETVAAVSAIAAAAAA